jgi:hypothetical protein
MQPSEADQIPKAEVAEDENACWIPCEISFHNKLTYLHFQMIGFYKTLEVSTLQEYLS